MKLIRLVTENDGFFKSSFGNEMTIKPNAKMCLLNLTFQTAFEVLVIDSRNSDVTFFTDTSDDLTKVEVVLTERSYSLNQISEFYDDVVYALNSAISDQEFNNGIGSAFDIRLSGGLRQIEYRYAPFLNPLFLPDQNNLFMLDNDKVSVVTSPLGTGGYYNLPFGNEWTSSAGPTENFYTDNVGDIATYRRVQTPGSAVSWFQAVKGSSTDWLIYAAAAGGGPPVEGQNHIAIATIDTDTGILSVQNAGGGATTTFTPQQVPEFIEAGGTTTIRLNIDIGATSNRSNNLITGLGKISAGSALMTARIKTSFDNGGGEQNNGFALCLSRFPLTELIAPGQDIPVEYRTFEIRYNRPADSYVFIDSEVSVDEQDSGHYPNLVNGGILDNHDTLFYEIIGNTLSGGVLKTDGSIASVTKTIFFTYVFAPGEKLYPYMYIRGTHGTCSIDMFNYTISPWVNNRYDNNTEDTPPYWSLTGTNFLNNPHSALTNGIQSVLDNGTIFAGIGDNSMILPQLDRWQETKTCQLDLNAQIWNFLGYNVNFNEYDEDSIESKTINMGPTSGRDCWNFWIPAQEPAISLSDNFIVESMSVNLDSYDASEIFYSNVKDKNGNNPVQNPETEKKGRRKNILATIPVNDNTNGLVEYETNNLIFIDINNNDSLNLRNLNFRVLNKNFNPISQSGTSAVMTILIDD